MRLVIKTKKGEVLLAAFCPPVPAEVLQRCELDSRKFSLVCTLCISPLFLLCSSYSPSPVLLVDGGLVERRANIIESMKR